VQKAGSECFPELSIIEGSHLNNLTAYLSSIRVYICTTSTIRKKGSLFPVQEFVIRIFTQFHSETTRPELSYTGLAVGFRSYDRTLLCSGDNSLWLSSSFEKFSKIL